MEFVTPEKIIAHREERKKTGLIGCITGEDIPLTSLKGMSWRPSDPMNPGCFCHDCRSLWDKDGSIDLELIKRGNERALFVYASILPSKKDILRDLRSNTDDALEDFVKAQVNLSHTMKETEAAQKEYDYKMKVYRDMFHNATYDVLKRFEKEMDEMDRELAIGREKLLHMKDEERTLEAMCHKTEEALSNARRIERDYIESNF